MRAQRCSRSMTYAVNVPSKIGDEMSHDDDPYASLWDHAPPPHKPRPAERVFEFTRASDGRRLVVDVKFHGESYGGRQGSSRTTAGYSSRTARSRRERWPCSGRMKRGSS